MNGYTIVTFDSDFYDFSSLLGFPPKIVWIRTGNMTTKNIAQIINHKVVEINEFINADELQSAGCLQIIENK